MEIVKEYWYVFAIAIVGLLILSRQNSGAQLQQIGGASGDTLALAQVAAAERDADETRRFDAMQNLLNYDLSLRQLKSNDALARIGLGQQLDLARISADAQARAMTNQFQLASLQAQIAQSQFDAQYRLQQYQMQTAANTQRRNDWLGAISTGIQTVVPFIFGNSTSGGNMNIPSTPPIFGGGFGFNF